MYLAGAPHAHKTDAQILLERAIASQQRLVTDAEVLQEMLHRYAAIGRRDAITPTLQSLLSLADEVFPIEKLDVLRASEIVQQPTQLSARDALHIAVMERQRVKRIMTFDADFDRWPGIERVYQV